LTGGLEINRRIISMRSKLTAAVVIITTLVGTMQAYAHHGWAWTTGGNVELSGIIRTTRLGNPHGVLTVSTDDETWTVEVGQPWRNERAGLKDGDLAPGVEIRIIGEPSANIEDRKLKAERLFINEQEYPLYPNRD
jgi:hypothetical protein